MSSILLIEDREGLRQVYADFLKRCGYHVQEAAKPDEARLHLAKREYDLILSDYMLPGCSGLDFLKELRNKEIDTPLIMMTAFGEVKLAVSAIQAGAFDFLEKPIDLEYLKLVVGRALEFRRDRRDKDFRASRRNQQRETIVGQSPALRDALAMAEKVAPSDTNCLILGESGVGKELFAQHVHSQSGRMGQPLISINCASIPHELMESELFGHEKGAFTGAVAKKIGLIEAADGGSVFLDEIGELPLELQPKLLRVLQSREFFRVGGNRVLKSDIRVICATNRDLKRGVREGWFREDLYYRLAVFPIEVPPLRNRLEDLPALCDFFLEKYGGKALDPSLMPRLKAYSWPGNIRELSNLIERATILSEGMIGPEHFPEEILSGADTVTGVYHLNLDQTLKQNLTDLEPQVEKRYLAMALKRENGAREATAKRAGVSVKTLYNKIKTYELDP